MFRLNCLFVFCLLVQSSHAQPTTQPIDLSQQKTLYVVGYAHLDTQWRWAYPLVIREYIPNTMTRNFALFEKYPNYIFNFSGSRRYEMMKEYYPKDFAKLKEYIAKNRWFVCGSSVDENDANVPSAESQIRHILYGNHFSKREFGTVSNEFMLPDCFGFPAALPSILAHCGIRGFSTQKLTWNSAVGIPFKVGVWKGVDGEGVIAALDPGGYGASVAEDLSQSAAWLKRIENTGKIANVYADYHYYGTGDRGGAPTEGSADWVEKSIAGKGPIKVVSSTAEKMFLDITDAQREKLPTYQGELLLTEHSAGSVTSQAYMKRWNRKNELLADAAERASVAAMWLGGAAYPSRRLYDAWDLVLGSQMHDMLPGTSLPKCYEYCWNDELIALNQFGNIATHGVGVVADAMDTQTEGTPVVVYNPLSIDREDVVEADAPLNTNVRVIGPDGQAVPSQSISTTEGKKRITFIAKVPATGFAVYQLEKIGDEAVQNTLRVNENSLENDRFKVTLNDAGDIASILDKKSNRETLSAPIQLAFLYENPSAFPAWNMDWNDRQNPPRSYVTGKPTFLVVETGPVRVALEVTRESEGSKFVQRISLASGDAGDRIEVANLIDWQTQERSLKATFSFVASNPKATYDIQLGTLERGNNEPKKYEVPQHQWFDLTDASGAFGAAVINDCKYGSDKPADNMMRLTMLYTPGTRGGYADQGTQDIGRHEMVYAIAPHDGDWRAGKIPWIAQRVNQPMRAFVTTKHAGSLGKAFSLLKLNTDQAAVQSIKKAEDSDEIIVRIKELTGKPADDVRLTFPSAIASAREVDGQERMIGDLKPAGDTLQTHLGAYRLRTFAIKLNPPASTVAATASTSVELPFDIDAISSDENTSDGSFDADGRTFPAEQLPATIECEGVSFKIGSAKDGEKNALICRGQTIKILAGESVYLLAASVNGDQTAWLKTAAGSTNVIVQNWGGYIGQWDNRLWDREIPETSTNVDASMCGLAPGYVKRGNIAWFASHRHKPETGNDIYQYCYLYKYKIRNTDGGTELTLPNNENIRIFAITAAKDAHDDTTPARPLSDTLQYQYAPSLLAVEPAGGKFDDVTSVSIKHGLYWNQNEIRYTLDGSEPTAESHKYVGPINLTSSATLRARRVMENGISGEEIKASFDINDITPPRVVKIIATSIVPTVRIELNESVRKADAETPANYQFNPAAKVVSAAASEDGKSILLTLDSPLTQACTLSIRSVRDLSNNANAIASAPIDVSMIQPIYTSESVICNGQEKVEKVDSLPSGASQPWTINFFVRADKQPENRTIIAGFGQVSDDAGNGIGRYLCKFANGIHYWSRAQDVDSRVKLDLGRWQMLSAAYDGKTLRLFKDGKQIGAREIVLADDQKEVHFAPVDPWDNQRRFTGEIRQFSIWNESLGEDALAAIYSSESKSLPATAPSPAPSTGETK